MIVLIAGAYAIFHKSNKSNDSMNNVAAVNNSIVSTKSNSTYGSYLVTPSGATLYTYQGDSTGVSNCTGECLKSWPAYRDTATSTKLPANFTVIKRGDGSVLQYAYNGKPLYLYANDTKGNVEGNGVGGFYVAKP